MKAVTSIMSTLGLKGKPTASPSLVYHPLNPLGIAEMTAAASAVDQYLRAQDSVQAFSRLWYKAVTLKEPPKSQLAPYLDSMVAGVQVEKLSRQVDVLVGAKRGKEAATWYEIILTLPRDGASSPSTIDSCVVVPPHHHVACDGEEMNAAEEALLNNEDFKKLIAGLGLPADATVIADGWVYGSDTTENEPRYITFMCYLRFSEFHDSNHYAAPLPFNPTVNADTLELIDIAYAPIFGGDDTRTIKDLDGPFPWDQYVRNEYAHHIREADGLSSRTDLKPLQVIQPEGTSFELTGRIMKWQKWQFHIGFNFREGIVINDVRYDGRQLFHRLSVSDMTVPYGDPRYPFHRKQAFDLGDCGAGYTTNSLALGCDCLGQIAYLDFDYLTPDGKSATTKNAVCIHEQDDSLLWKHTNFRTNNPSVTRSRILIVQQCLTVANYEYVFAFKFDQAAALHLETRATGIVSTHAIMPGETSPYGAIVNPGVYAPNHQHLFSVRIDPAIDGHKNTVVQEDVVPMPFDKANPPANNPYGVGFVVEKTPIQVASFADAAPEKNRVFKIINPNKLNKISGRPVGYKLVPTPSQMMLAHPDSIAYARAEFGDHHIWVTSHRDNELYSGGHYTNQSNGRAEGIKSWVARKDNVQDDDLVLWHTFGLTHICRVEDFPVMPCEVHVISLKPCDFFEASPANDVPSSTQKFNQSKAYQPAVTQQGNAAIEDAAKANGLNSNGKQCCK